MTHIQQMAVEFASAEDFSEAMKDTAWDIDFRQLSRGSGSLPVHMVVSESLMLLKMSSSSLVRQQALPPAGHVTLGIMDNPKASARFGNQVLDWNSLTLFDPNAGMDCISAEGFSAYTLSFPSDRADELTDSLGFKSPAQALNRPTTHQLMPSAQLQRIRLMLKAVYEAMNSPSERIRSNALQAAETDLSAALLTAWNNGEEVTRTPLSGRRRVLQRALDYISAHTGDMISVEELCRESACSISTLERTFKGHFGISPKQYLTAIRLSDVRRCLLNPADRRNIAEVAAELGFWHMSKFAQDYRRMYAQLPSQTRATLFSKSNFVSSV